MPVSQPILCFNYGSSFLKFALYLLGDKEETFLAGGEVERIGTKEGQLWIRDAEKELLRETRQDFAGHKTVTKAILTLLAQSNLPEPEAAGHRVVHGEPDYTAPARVDSQLLKALRRLIPFCAITPA